MQYENVFKVIGGVHVILELVGRWLLRVLVLGLLRWISVYLRTHGQNKAQQ